MSTAGRWQRYVRRRREERRMEKYGNMLDELDDHLKRTPTYYSGRIALWLLERIGKSMDKLDRKKDDIKAKRDELK
jgi:hypothetical protein